MREANQQQTVMDIECSSSVYKTLHMTLQSARDAMVLELQEMQKLTLVEEALRASVQPAHITGDPSILSNGINSDDEPEDWASQSDGSMLEGSSRKRVALSGCVTGAGPKQARLLFHGALETEP